MPTNNFTQNKTLIVGGQESDLALLEALLKKKVYSQFNSLTDSRQVISTFQEWKPDFYLLSLTMTPMDGFTIVDELSPLMLPGKFALKD